MDEPSPIVETSTHLLNASDFSLEQEVTKVTGSPILQEPELPAPRARTNKLARIPQRKPSIAPLSEATPPSRAARQRVG